MPNKGIHSLQNLFHTHFLDDKVEVLLLAPMHQTESSRRGNSWPSPPDTLAGVQSHHQQTFLGRAAVFTTRGADPEIGVGTVGQGVDTFLASPRGHTGPALQDGAVF